MKSLVFCSFFFLIVFNCSAQTVTVDSVQVIENEGEKLTLHKVVRGESLYSIAKNYGVTVMDIYNHNNLSSTKISIDQILEIPIKNPSETSASQSKKKHKIHVVQKGETLFSIAQKYQVSASNIIKWNQLKSSHLAINQELIIKEKKSQNVINQDKKETDPNIETYQVKKGETLFSIGKKLNLPVDSLIKWNNLEGKEIKVGQQLVYHYPNLEDRKINIGLNKTKKIQEGLAMVIENLEEEKMYHALHRTLPYNTKLEVKNLMNNKKVFVRVIGKLPDTGLNENIIIRLSPYAFRVLGILDEKARVELYYLD